jgi:hypothetical protein
MRRGLALSPSPPSVDAATGVPFAESVGGGRCLGLPGASSQRNGTVTGVPSDGVDAAPAAALSLVVAAARDRMRMRGSALSPLRPGSSAPMLAQRQWDACGEQKKPSRRT